MIRDFAPSRLRAWVFLVCLIGCAAQTRAGTLTVDVSGGDLRLADAVVSLHSASAAAAVRPGSAIVDQRDAQFVPRVTVIQAGSSVRFPNSDDTRHQVYSFSPAKRFNLPLYHGTTAEPVVFDVPGVVELGCNIHDWMVAYIVVLDSPYHALTDAGGRARLVAPPGRYQMRVWHPQLARHEGQQWDVVVGQGSSQRSVRLELAAPVAAPAAGDEKLRALQEKFRRLKRGK